MKKILILISGLLIGSLGFSQNATTNANTDTVKTTTSEQKPDPMKNKKLVRVSPNKLNVSSSAVAIPTPPVNATKEEETELPK
jgi:hypothetical protein